MRVILVLFLFSAGSLLADPTDADRASDFAHRSTLTINVYDSGGRILVGGTPEGRVYLSSHAKERKGEIFEAWRAEILAQGFVFLFFISEKGDLNIEEPESKRPPEGTYVFGRPEPKRENSMQGAQNLWARACALLTGGLSWRHHQHYH